MATNFPLTTSTTTTTDHHEEKLIDLVPYHNYSSTFYTSPFFEFPNHHHHDHDHELLETIFKTSTTTTTQSEEEVQPPPPPPTNSQHEEADGYNWRKYGQKQMKGSENPRSYYRCVFHNCPTKKKVERDFNQKHVIEIVYTGTHTHPKPNNPPNNNIKQEPDTTHDQIHHSKHDQDQQQQQQPTLVSDVAGVVEQREPKVVIQTRSIVDILKDGYKWRKYGQKSVKGNLNPRSYYKCANKGCSVRKQVERASEDLRDVVTTYEGKHNHDIPTIMTQYLRRGGDRGVGVFGWSKNGNENKNFMPIRPIATASNYLNNNSFNAFQDAILSSNKKY